VTTVLTPSEIFLPTMRGPNKVVPLPVSAPEHPYVIGRPRFSVENWTPDDQYAGPALLPGELIRESRERGGRGNWARRSIKSTDVPIFRGSARFACRGSARDFYSDAPTDFWPCTRESMEKIGMNAEIRVNPTMIDLGETQVTGTGKAVAVAALAGLATFLIARRVLRNR
jgi:hypothetical protein